MWVELARQHLELALEALDHCIDAPPSGPIYTARTDRFVQPKPAPLTLGPAGFQFTDPSFGTLLTRVTDEHTSGGSSCRMPSSSHATAWNCDGSKFYVVNEGGGAIFYGVDGMHTERLNNAIGSQLEPQFSFVDRSLIWGVSLHQVKNWRLDTGTVADVFNFDAAYPSLPLQDTYIGGILLADDDVWMAHFGGSMIDQHVFIHHSTAGLFDVRGLGWKIHATSIDRTGRYVNIYPAVDPNTGQLPPGVAQVQVWDTHTGALAPMTNHPAGHGCMGYEQFVNQDCCTSGSWDASQWQIRNLATPNDTRDLIAQVLDPKATSLAEHSNWRHTRRDVRVPIISASYRFGEAMNGGQYPWRAWDEEIIAVATDGSGTVWRFCHHQSVYSPTNFWAEPLLHCSPDGRFVTFASTWGDHPRTDVFLLALT